MSSFLWNMLGFKTVQQNGPSTKTIILVGIIVLGSGYVFSSLAKLIKSVDDLDDDKPEPNNKK
jgi:hypothetical protein